MSKPIVVTTENHDDLISKNNFLILDFWAEWCGPCKSYGLIINSLSESRSDVFVGKIDCDTESELTARYGIKNIPTTLFLKNQEVVERKTGILQIGELNEIIDKLI